MCIFHIPEKVDKASVDFAKAMHEKYYLPLVALVAEMDEIRKEYKQKVVKDEAELPKLLEEKYLPQFKELVLSFALEGIAPQSNKAVDALKLTVENAFRRTQKYVDWKDYKFAVCERRAALHKETWPCSRDYFDSKAVYEELYAQFTTGKSIVAINPETIGQVALGQGYSDLVELFHAPGTLLEELDFDYRYQWKNCQGAVTVIISRYGILETIE